MNPALRSGELRPAPSQETCELEAPRLSLLLLYEDRNCAARAVQSIDSWNDHSPDPQKLHWNPWRFDVLLIRPEAERARNEAVEADLIVIAMCGSKPVPGHIRRWLDGVLSRRAQAPPALAAILAGHLAGSPTECELRALAERAGADFLLARIDPPPHESPDVQAHLDERTEKVSDLLGEILRRTDHVPCPRLN